MSNTIKIRRGSGVPTASDFDSYELAYDYTGNDLYVKVGSNMVKVNSEGSGTVTNVVAGNGLSGGGTVTATLDLDFSQLTDMTSDISGTTEFILQNGTTESRKAASEIKLTAFDATGFTIAGTVDTSGSPSTSEYARFTDNNTIEGRSYSAVRNDLGLNIGSDVLAYNASVQTIAALNPGLTEDGKVLSWNEGNEEYELVNQSSGTITSVQSMTNNYVLTASGSTTLQGESNLTFNGSLLSNTGDIRILSGSLGVNTNANSTNGRIAATSHIEAGVGSGAIGLTINDGGGNSNVTFNHTGRVPEQNGQAARIEVNTDATSTEGLMYFEVSSADVTSGSAITLPNAMTLAHDYMDIPYKLRHMGDIDTYLQFDNDRLRMYAGGTLVIDSNNTYLTGSVNLASQVTGTLPLANGGTGATSAAGARLNLQLGDLALLDNASISDVTGLQTALDGKVPTSRTISGVGLTGTGSLASNRTFTVDYLAATDDRDVKPNAITTSGRKQVRAYFSSLGGLTGSANSDYQDLLVLSTYSDGTGGDVNALAFDKSEQKIRHYLADQSATTWGTAKTIAYTDSTMTGTWQGTAIDATYIGSLPASKITSGTFGTARIPNLSASKITSGTFADARIASSSEWNEAYTWGDHSTAGYLTSSSTQSKYLRSDANDTATGTMDFTGRVNIGNSLTRPDALDSDGDAHVRIGGSDVYLYVASLGASGGYDVAVQAARASDFASFDLNLQANGGNLQRAGNKVWDAGNDGSGSGLDADLLDGLHGSSFTRKGVQSGTPNTASSRTTFTCNDAIPTTSGNQSGLEVWQDTVGADAFMTFHVAGDYAVYFGLDGGTNDLAVGGWSRGANSYKIWHQGNDGSGSTLDADLLDGLHGSSYWSKSGSWVGDLGSNGYTRVQGVSNGGGEFVLALKNGQLHTLVDGSYIAYEASTAAGGGFWSSYNSNYGNASGFKASANDKIRVQQLDGGTADLEVTGNIKLTNERGLLWDYTPSTANGGYIAHPGGGMYRTSTGNHTGALTITLPTGGGPADMISFWVDVFDYTSYESQSFYIAGYAYQTAGSNEWVNETALMLTPKENHARTVRFGHDGTNHCVYIGELADVWSYPQVTVRNVQVGYASDVDTYNDNWDISFEASAFQNVDATYSGSDTLPTAGKIKMKDGSGKFIHNTTSSRDKIRVWSSGSYAIGMQSSFTFGGLENQYAMTFQMNNQSSERGFWWGDDGHNQAQGAMALTTAGELTVADSIRVGYGESDTTTPGATFDLDVDGQIYVRNTGTASFALGEATNHLRMKGNGTDAFNFLNSGNGWANLYFNRAFANDYFQANNNGSLLKLNKSSWSNAPTHDIIYNAYRGTMGDYTYIKSAGNGGTNHGQIIVADSYIFMGRTNIEQGHVYDSATAPMDDVYCRIDTTGNALFTGDVVASSTLIASDIRLKENVEDLNYGLKDVMNMRAVSFDWKDKRNKTHDIGVIAQEMETIIPEVVNEIDTLNSDGEHHKTVDYAKLTSVLIKAIQEQQQQINELKEKLNG